MQQIKKSQYRQRVFQAEDGSVLLVFGGDPAPENAKLLADHDVLDITTVTDHVEPEPTPIEPTPIEPLPLDPAGPGGPSI